MADSATYVPRPDVAAALEVLAERMATCTHPEEMPERVGWGARFRTVWRCTTCGRVDDSGATYVGLVS